MLRPRRDRSAHAGRIASRLRCVAQYPSGQVVLSHTAAWATFLPICEGATRAPLKRRSGAAGMPLRRRSDTAASTAARALLVRCCAACARMPLALRSRAQPISARALLGRRVGAIPAPLGRCSVPLRHCSPRASGGALPTWVRPLPALHRVCERGLAQRCREPGEAGSTRDSRSCPPPPPHTAVRLRRPTMRRDKPPRSDNKSDAVVLHRRDARSATPSKRGWSGPDRTIGDGRCTSTHPGQTNEAPLRLEKSKIATRRADGSQRARRMILVPEGATDLTYRSGACLCSRT